MAYTFGAGTGDDVNFTGAIGIGGSAAMGLVCGWFYPTTLTSGRYYWSHGNTVGLGVHSTTSEVTYTTANATTNGVWTSSGAGIVTNKWQFLAVMATQTNTGPAMTVKGWIYDDALGWRDLGFTQTTAPAGNFTGGTAHTVGNRGTGTVAFQGDIDLLVTIAMGTVNGCGALPVVTAGSITAHEWEKVTTNIIMPLCYGTLKFQTLDPSGLASSFEVMSFHFDEARVSVRRRVDTQTSGSTVPTVNGATSTAARSRLTWPSTWMNGAA